MAARGYNCVLTLGSNILGKARTVEPTFTSAEQDITTRDSDGWDEGQPGRRRMTARIEALWVPTNAAVKALLDTYFTQANLTFRMEDEDGEGYFGTCFMTEFTMGPQDLDNAVMCSASIRSTGLIGTVSGSTTTGAA